MVYFFAICYLLAIVLQPSEWIPLFDGFPLVEFFLVFGIMSGFVQQNERFFRALWSTPSKYFIAFILVSILSAVPQGFSYALPVVGFLLVKYYLGFLVLVVALEDTVKLRKAFLWVTLAGIIVGYLCIRLDITGVGVGQGIGTSDQTLNWRGAVQWVGTYEGTNTSGQLLLLLIAIAFGLSYKETAFFRKYFLLAATGVIGYSFILTNSRGGFLGLMALMGFFVYSKMNIKLKYFLPLGVLGLVAILVLKPTDEGRGLGESSTPERVELFHQGLQMFKDNPVLGVGAGQFSRNNSIRKTAHNIYLNTISETGILGFFVFVMMYYVSIRELIRLRTKLDSESLDYRTMQPIIYALLSFAVSAFFLSSQHEIRSIILAFVMIPTFNNKVSYDVSFKEYKYIIGIICIFLAVIYALVQLFFIFFR